MELRNIHLLQKRKLSDDDPAAPVAESADPAEFDDSPDDDLAAPAAESADPAKFDDSPDNEPAELVAEPAKPAKFVDSPTDELAAPAPRHTLSAFVSRYGSMLIGTSILAFGLYNIHSRCGISEGGVLGLSLLIYQWFHISPAISSPIMDMICFGIGTLVMGKRFLGDSIVASLLYACWYRVYEFMGPVLPDLTEFPFAAALLGGILVGLGCGLVVRNDCAAGGDDALAITFHKLTGMKLAQFYVFSDFAVLLLSLSYIPFRRIGWSLLTVLISSGVIELIRIVEEKFRNKKGVKEKTAL